MPKEILSPEALDALRKTHGAICAIETPLGTAAFRCPTPEVYSRALAMQANETQAVHAARFLAVECVVHPARAVFETWVARRPGITKAADGPITRLAGMDQEASAADADDGDTTTVTTSLGVATFKVPDETQWNKYRRMASAKDPQAAVSWLALACVVVPERTVFAEWIAQRPGIAATVVPHIQRIAGVEEEERLKD